MHRRTSSSTRVAWIAATVLAVGLAEPQIGASRAPQRPAARTTPDSLAPVFHTGDPSCPVCPPGLSLAGGRDRVADVTQDPNAPRSVLVEFVARPLLDHTAPGIQADIESEHVRFAADLARIDLAAGPLGDSIIVRDFNLLFNGVAATVTESVRQDIARLPYVARVWDDEKVHAELKESVPLVGAPTAWNAYGLTGAGIKVAILDTGVDYRHPDLGGCFGTGCKVVGGYDFVNNDSDPMDDYPDSHGTHVAGIVAANGTMKGVAPDAKLLAYKVLSSSGWGANSGIIAALERALVDGANVANLSLGGPGTPFDPWARCRRVRRCR
jgi:hypothetical protein